MTSRTVTCETSSPPSTTNHQRQTPTDARGEVRGQGQVNQGLSAPPKKGTVGAGSVATSRTNRERLDGRAYGKRKSGRAEYAEGDWRRLLAWQPEAHALRASTPALSKALRAPATVAACGAGCMDTAMSSPARRFPRLVEPSPRWARGWAGVRAG